MECFVEYVSQRIPFSHLLYVFCLSRLLKNIRTHRLLFHNCFCIIPFRCRTVSLETGMQNTQLCSTIVQLSFTPEQLELMFTFPLIYSIFQLLFAALILGGKV